MSLAICKSFSPNDEKCYQILFSFLGWSKTSHFRQARKFAALFHTWLIVGAAAAEGFVMACFFGSAGHIFKTIDPIGGFCHDGRFY